MAHGPYMHALDILRSLNYGRFHQSYTPINPPLLSVPIRTGKRIRYRFHVSP